MLAHEILRAESGTPDRAMLFLHGILGSGQNLRTIARKFVAARPSYQAVLVDLRHHGDSHDVAGADTLEQAATDCAELAASIAPKARAVFGHSFGGKVALAWLDLQRDRNDLEHVFVIDSTPGARPDARGSENTMLVIDLLASMPGPFASRDEFIKAIEARGQTKMLAQWLAQSLRRNDDGWRFGPPLSRVRLLLDSYFAKDLWPVLEHPPSGSHIHLVAGTRSAVLDEADLQRMRNLEADSGEKVTLDRLEAGHWVHVDDPEGLLRVMIARTERMEHGHA